MISPHGGLLVDRTVATLKKSEVHIVADANAQIDIHNIST